MTSLLPSGHHHWFCHVVWPKTARSQRLCRGLAVTGIRRANASPFLAVVGVREQLVINVCDMKPLMQFDKKPLMQFSSPRYAKLFSPEMLLVAWYRVSRASGSIAIAKERPPLHLP